MPDWPSIADCLRSAGIDVGDGVRPNPVGGGDISAAWKLAGKRNDFFVKTGPLSAAEMFSAEADGLAEIAATGTLRVPVVLASGETADDAFLVLEWLDFETAGAPVEARFGEQLAELHRVHSDRFGWRRDNTIGLTPQPNGWSDDWVGFFRERRLAVQFRLAADNGFGGDLERRGDRLLERLPDYFDGRQPAASLLHGDLWGGNWACSAGDPVVFDPAVYYGDRETDIAMTRLFGGFSAAFYDAYESVLPPSAGYRERECLYQLYHVLNHLNLFGGAYLGKAISLIDEIL